MWALCEQCAAEGLPVYLYGSSEETLSVLSKRLLDAFPALDICGFEAPPFRPASVEEDKATVSRINSSGAGIIFVALGCPKQERWMTEHRGRVKGVMIGVGAAFDFFAGTVRQAPRWMQDRGLEWAFRLSVEPRRLWKRYLFTNSYFVARVAKEWVAEKRGNH